MQATTKEWVLDTVSQLPEKEMEQLRDYLEFLMWKTEQWKSEGQHLSQRIIEVVEQSHDVTMEDAEALLQAIEEGKRPVRFGSPFEPGGKS